MTLVLRYLLIFSALLNTWLSAEQKSKVERVVLPVSIQGCTYFITSVNKQYCFPLLEENIIWLGIYACPVPICTNTFLYPGDKYQGFRDVWLVVTLFSGTVQLSSSQASTYSSGPV